MLVKQFFYDRLIALKIPSMRQCWNSWRRILYIGLPSGITNVIINIAIAFIMKFLAPFSDAAVAGFGIAIRIEDIDGIAFAVSVFADFFDVCAGLPQSAECLVFLLPGNGKSNPLPQRVQMPPSSLHRYHISHNAEYDHCNKTRSPP